MFQGALLALTLCDSPVSRFILSLVAPRAFLEAFEVIVYFPTSGPLHHLLSQGLSSPPCAHHFPLLFLILAYGSLSPVYSDLPERLTSPGRHPPSMV